MNILIKLYLSFFKIGLFGFGGGYAMISLIEEELIKHNWLDVNKLIDIIAISEMTPGSIAINSATFVGYRIADFGGAIMATLGVISPSFILVILLAIFYHKVKNNNSITDLLESLRPAVIALIIAVSYIIGKTAITDWKGVLIAGVTLSILIKTEVHPLFIILLSGISGIFLYI